MNFKPSIIIPIYNEVESIFSLVDEILLIFKKYDPEIIIVDDGSKDGFNQTFKRKRYNSFKKIRIINHKVNIGKCMAMLSGIKSASNSIVGVIDGDGQNPPNELLRMFQFWEKKINENENFQVICGHRVNRQDTFLKKISSKLANSFRKWMLNDDCYDTACAMKVFKKTDYLKIPYFKNVHRFIPALFKMNKGTIINFKVNDRVRTKGKSKYNFNNRFWVGIIDVYKVWVLISKKE